MTRNKKAITTLALGFGAIASAVLALIAATLNHRLAMIGLALIWTICFTGAYVTHNTAAQEEDATRAFITTSESFPDDGPIIYMVSAMDAGSDEMAELGMLFFLSEIRSGSLDIGGVDADIERVRVDTDFGQETYGFAVKGVRELDEAGANVGVMVVRDHALIYVMLVITGPDADEMEVLEEFGKTFIPYEGDGGAIEVPDFESDGRGVERMLPTEIEGMRLATDEELDGVFS